MLLYGSHEALRNFIHVEDVARIVALAIQHGIQGTYSCANVKNVTYSEVAEAAIEAFGSTSKIRYVPSERDVPDNIFEPDESLYREIGFYPQISIADGMERVAVHRRESR